MRWPFASVGSTLLRQPVESLLITQRMKCRAESITPHEVTNGFALRQLNRHLDATVVKHLQASGEINQRRWLGERYGGEINDGR